jgi:hypothetical protein
MPLLLIFWFVTLKKETAKSLKDASQPTILHLDFIILLSYKKRDRTESRNCRGKSQLPTAYKMFTLFFPQGKIYTETKFLTIISVDSSVIDH